MVNSVSNSFSNSFAGSKIASNDYVMVDGKRYPVQKKPDNFPGLYTIAPKYKEVVVIDGKEYPVKTVKDDLACDKTKDVVIIDGKEYTVNDSSDLLPQFFDSLFKNKLNCVA